MCTKKHFSILFLLDIKGKKLSLTENLIGKAIQKADISIRQEIIQNIHYIMVVP